MDSKTKPYSARKKEWIFQIILHLTVFHFLVMDHEKGRLVYELDWYQGLFFFNYVWANLLISYVLLPKFFYRKQYLPFSLYILLLITAVILIEEFVLEVIFFPDTRGADFNGVLLSLGEVLSVLVALAGMKIAWDAIHRQRELDELRVAVKESELSFLNSQINPHFLFNNLNNLYAYAVEQSPKTPDIILGMSGVLRYMLYECREETVPLTKEIEHLRHFIELYELQIEDRGTVTFETQNIQGPYRIAPLILSVFIENAFKHSQSGQSEHIKIDIAVTVHEEGLLTFICTNNFKHLNSPDRGENRIGLANVKKRLHLLYPNHHQLAIRHTQQEFSVNLSIQLSKA
jgi:two-component system LytT family sensor kinase